MKRLISTIVLVILAMPLTGCVPVPGHHPGHGHRGPIVTRPRHLPVPPLPLPHPNVHPRAGGHGRHRF
jgi:hypothetical protein